MHWQIVILRVWSTGILWIIVLCVTTLQSRAELLLQAGLPSQTESASQTNLPLQTKSPLQTKIPLETKLRSQTKLHSQTRLPSVVSTNLCADIFALGLLDSSQLLSVSRKSQNPSLSPFAAKALQFPGNESSAEEIIALRPDIALVSRRWQSRHQTDLLESHGIRMVIMTFPITWDDIFASTRQLADQLGRRSAAELLLEDLAARLQALKQQARPFNVVYLRPNGGSAGANTYVDTLLKTVGAMNHASDQGRVGWGPYPLELLVLNPPEIFLLGAFHSDGPYAKTGYSRHPLLQRMMAQTPQVKLDGNYWGCGSWLLIEAAENIAGQLDDLFAENGHTENGHAEKSQAITGQAATGKAIAGQAKKKHSDLTAREQGAGPVKGQKL